MALEKPNLRIGYTPLNDCAPLIVAHELGLFAEHGLNVRLERQNSWATSRDMLAIGALDAAHMLAPAVVAAWMGDGQRNLIAPMALNLNGNTIVLSLPLFAELAEVNEAAGNGPALAADALGEVVRKRAARGDRPLFLAAVFAESNHNLDLHRWLRAGGVVPEKDVRIGVVPPAEVEQFLARGIIDGFCVGEPWGSLAVARGFGRIVATSYDLWSNRIEKVLGVGVPFAAANPATLDALLQAVLRGAQWADQPSNRAAVASLLVHGGYVDAPIEVVRRGLTGRVPFAAAALVRENPDFTVFYRYAANFPWLSQADWFGRALAEAGVTPAHGAPCAAFRPDLLARAAREVGMPFPLADSKPEAAHARPWLFENASTPIQMGREIAFDGANFEQDA